MNFEIRQSVSIYGRRTNEDEIMEERNKKECR